jgi:hypothetical protein
MYNVIRKFTFGGSIMAVWQLTAYAKTGTNEFKSIIEALNSEDIKIFAMSVGEIKDHTVVRSIADDVNNRANECIFDIGLIVKPKRVVCVQIPDGFKGMADVLYKMAGNGVCVDYSYSFFNKHDDEFCAVFRPADIDLAELVLKKSGYKVYSDAELGQF